MSARLNLGNLTKNDMASVNYKLLTKSNPSNIYCRFLHGRKIDVRSKINVYVDPKNWDFKHQKIKNIISVKNRDQVNRKLAQLKIEIIDNYNLAFIEGEIIDREWLYSIVNDFFNRPKRIKGQAAPNHSIYYLDFAEWWIEEKSKTWMTSANSYMNDRTKAQYNSFLQLIKEFQNKSRIKLNNSGFDTISKFVVWMNDGGYADKTISRHVNRFKFFFERAKQEGHKIDPTYEQRIFVPKSQVILEPFLDPNEIQKIFNLKLNDVGLDNARDNLIIACWTGLRISDFLNNLDISNFIDDYIEIITTKTRKAVVIPVHPMVKRILIKHKGQLPNKVNDPVFNKQIKIVCKLAGIINEMQGRIYDKKIKRKVVGLYEKFELVTSHIGRRSFATNLFGKLSNEVIMSVCGWSKSEMLFKYIKKSNRDHAIQLKEYWETIYKDENYE